MVSLKSVTMACNFPERRNVGFVGICRPASPQLETIHPGLPPGHTISDLHGSEGGIYIPLVYGGCHSEDACNFF